MSNKNDFLSGKNFKILTSASGVSTPPEGRFHFVRPVGVSATWKGKSGLDLVADGCADHAVGGVYANAGLEEYGVDSGSYTEITVSAGTIKAYYW